MRAMLKLAPHTLTLPAALLALVFFSGCAKRAQSMNPYKEEEFNLLGIYRSKPNSFNPVSPVSLSISTKEVMLQRENFSGRERSFLWGLVTFTDY
jgi:hypothetical protein